MSDTVHVRRGSQNTMLVRQMPTGIQELATHMELCAGDWIAFHRLGPPYEANIVALFLYDKDKFPTVHDIQEAVEQCRSSN